MQLESLSVWQIAAMVAAFVGAGLVRGFNGGAGANFVTAPVMALLVGAHVGVPVILLLNLISNVQVIPGALPHADWRRMLPVGVASVVCAPLGAWLLIAVPEDAMRRAVAGVAIALSLVLLAGWRYRGPRGPVVRTGIGALGGLMTGSVSMGGPPVFLYLMSGPGTAAQNRADFLTFGVMVQAAAVLAFAVSGLITLDTLILGAAMFVPFMLACQAGIRLFARASDDQFRKVTLWGIALLSLAIAVV